MQDPKHWGAHVDDWDTLAYVADVCEDLLPTVSNPGARIDPDSKLKTLGKVPSLYNASGMVSGIGKWVERKARPADITRWSGVPDYGICLQTRRVRALDVDIEDPEVAAQVFAVITKHFGEVPFRSRADSAKFLSAFWMPGEFTKRVLRTASGAIEFLADGQQFIAAGTHPKGARYHWAGGTPTAFPEIDRARFEQCWAELMDKFATEEVIEYGTTRGIKEARRDVDVDDPVADFLHMEGWVLSANGDGRLNIRCPFHEEHSTESADDTATQYMPKGVGGFDQGHFKCLHAHCTGRNDGEYLSKLGVFAQQFEILPPVVYEGPEEAQLPEFQRNPRSGQILVTINNVVLALRASIWLGVEVARDEFRDELMVTPVGRKAWRQFKDADFTRIRMQLAHKGLDASLELTKEAVNLVGDERRFDSAIAWLKNEVPEWDGVARIETFYSTVFGVAQDDYARALGQYTWTALAGRVLDPGCKVDMVPIIQGGQGLGKSQVVAAMVPDESFFTEIDLSDRDDNLSRLMRGKLIAELSELKGLHNRDIEAVKSFVTRRHEQWIPKYREFATTFPRRLLFMGTTNADVFLADVTGNRRWLPITATKADAAWVKANRDQLWAEARDLWERAGVLFSEVEHLATEHHDKYKDHDEWEEVIEAYLNNAEARAWEGEVFDPVAPIKVSDVLSGALGLQVQHINKREQQRVATVMKSLGYARWQGRYAGEKYRAWVNPNWEWVVAGGVVKK